MMSQIQDNGIYPLKVHPFIAEPVRVFKIMEIKTIVTLIIQIS